MKRNKLCRLLNILLSLILIFSIIPSFSINTSASNGVDDFVKRCYKVALQREPDTQGFNYWKSQITNEKLVGCSVVYNFIFSKEYTSQNKTDKQFVNDLYTMFMGRKADKEGYNYWCGKMKEGMSRQDVFAGFANSDEFYKLCTNYGITAGYYTNDFDFDKVNNVNLFVARLYKVCLGRIGDQGGQKYWVEGLLKGELTGIACAANYIKSTEYVSLKLTNEAYIENLYIAFMGRTFDAAGKAYWYEPLNNRETSRDQVFEGFANSKEFREICESYGITPGSYTATDFTKSPKDPSKEQSGNGGNTGNDNGNTGNDNGNTGNDNGNTGNNNGNTGNDNGNSGNDNGNTGNDNGNSGNDNGNTNNDPDNQLEQYTPKFEGDHGGYMNSKYPDKMPKAVIIVPSNATVAEYTAAALIQIYVEKEDGYKPEILTDATSKGSKGYEISVGNTNRPHGTAQYSSEGSYSIKSYDNGISIVGVGEYGLLCAAERFLEACGGYFYMSWDDDAQLYTNQKQFQIDKTNGISIDYKRAFVYTDSDVNYLASSSDLGRLYAVSYGYNGYMGNYFCVGDNKSGAYEWYLSAIDKDDGFYSAQPGVPIGLGHTLKAEFMEDPTIKNYLQNHPEDYCANNWYQYGETDDTQKERTNEQLCLYQAAHDENLYNLLLNYCYKILETDYDPNAPMQIISISKGDTSKVCICDKCINHRNSYGYSDFNLTESYELLELCNKLSKDIHKNNKYQNVYIDTLAYSHTYTLAAPKGMTADDHVIIRFAPIDRCYSHYLDCKSSEDYRNAKDYQYLKDWCAISDHVWIWDYSVNFSNTIAPNANVDVLQHDIKLYYSMGIEGIYFQGNDVHMVTNVEFGDIRNYILGRISQDPTRNYDEELAFFTDVYYGESGKYVREYMKRLEKQSANHQNSLEHPESINNCFQYMYCTYADADSWSDHSHKMSTSEVNACENLWNQINAIAANETPEHKARLKRLECSWRMVKSTLKAKEFSNSSTYANENAKLINDIKSTGASWYSILGQKKMSNCTYTSHIPDNWANSSDGTR